MVQQYLQHSTQKVVEALEMAVSELVSRRQNVLTPDFILLALLSQRDSEARTRQVQQMSEQGLSMFSFFWDYSC